MIGSFALGAVLALAWAPCAGPTLGAAFTLAASGGSLPFAVLTLSIFALGAAGSLIAAGYGLGKLAGAARANVGRAAAAGRYAFAALIALTGAFILTGSIIGSRPCWSLPAQTG